MLSGLPREKSIAAPLVLRRLAQLGYVEGTTLELVFRSGDGTPDLYPKLARELIAANCNVIFALVSEPLVRAFVDARTPVPVVFIATEFDPLERGIVASLARPGGNITGVYSPRALLAKSVELAHEILPGAKRFLIFVDEHSRDQLAHFEEVAQARGSQLIVIDFARQPYDLAAGFGDGRRKGAEIFIGLSSPVFANMRGELSTLLIENRLPAIVPGYMATQPGFLISYTYDPARITARAAELAVRILKGAKPGEIPVEQVGEFELIVNLKAAKVLGVKIPYSVLARATRMIE